MIKFLSARSLAFRGDNEIIGSLHNANYLWALELLTPFSCQTVTSSIDYIHSSLLQCTVGAYYSPDRCFYAPLERTTVLIAASMHRSSVTVLSWFSYKYCKTLVRYSPSPRCRLTARENVYFLNGN